MLKYVCIAASSRHVERLWILNRFLCLASVTAIIQRVCWAICISDQLGEVSIKDRLLDFSESFYCSRLQVTIYKRHYGCFKLHDCLCFRFLSFLALSLLELLLHFVPYRFFLLHRVLFFNFFRENINWSCHIAKLGVKFGPLTICFLPKQIFEEPSLSTSAEPLLNANDAMQDHHPIWLRVES